jgi:hypothetical protein
MRDPAAPPHVVVNGAVTYDNKGRVVEKYEPYFDEGFEYVPPSAAQRGQRTLLAYDPLGRIVTVTEANGSEQRSVFGIPPDLADPDAFEPTPWESYAYDQNDNAGRTHPGSAAVDPTHWNTPTSAVVDALGRTVSLTVRNGAASSEWVTTYNEFDAGGRLVRMVDALGRDAFRYVFDMANRRWRIDSIDAGRRDVVPDCMGGAIEARDSKGSLTLQTYDALHRPIRLWARTGASGPATLRERLEYGDAGRADQPAAARSAAYAANLLGQLTSHHDEAGVDTLVAVDPWSRPLEKRRRVIGDAPLVAHLAAAASNQWRVDPFVVDWQPRAGEALADVEARLLDPHEYVTSLTYDALGRARSFTFPEDAGGGRKTLHAEFNHGGKLERLALDGDQLVEHVAYDAKGQRVLVAYGNGVMTRYAHDPQTLRLAR